jgi:threonine synthase
MSALTDTLASPVQVRGAAGASVRDGAFGNAVALSCRACGARQALGAEFACLDCFGPLEVAYDPAVRVTREQILSGPANIWRYQPLLPVSTDVADLPGMDPGLTRLVRAHHLGRELGIDKLWVKDDTGNPTHSFKDRVVAVALAAARELGFTVLACPSTGNLANAVAAAAARAGIRSVVLIPKNLELPKVLTTAVYGGTLIAVDGTYDDVNRLATQIAASRRTGRSSTSTSGPTTPRGPRRWPSRWPSSWDGGSPGRSWSRLRQDRS